MCVHRSDRSLSVVLSLHIRRPRHRRFNHAERYRVRSCFVHPGVPQCAMHEKCEIDTFSFRPQANACMHALDDSALDRYAPDQLPIVGALHSTRGLKHKTRTRRADEEGNRTINVRMNWLEDFLARNSPRKCTLCVRPPQHAGTRQLSDINTFRHENGV